MLGVSCTSIGFAFLLFFLMICAISEGVRYRVKFIVFMTLSALGTIVCLPFMFFRIRSWKNALIPAWTARQSAKLIGINFTVRGKENIVQDSGSIVLINHQSSLDLYILAELWPVLQRCAVISKKEILYLGTFGLASWLWGTIFINRKNVEESRKVINSTIQSIKNAKTKLLFFPEGKRHSDTTLIPFKKGPFHVAVSAQAPIQPVVVSRYYFLNSKLKRFDSGNCYITILPAIPTEGLTLDDLPQLMEKTYNIMNKTFVKTSQEVLDKHVETLLSG